jgi:homoserine dehydrogenase
VLGAARHEPCDIVVEALGGVEPALTAIRAALGRGVHVVSANKAAIASDVGGLLTLANATGAKLAYSAAVGGAVPVLERIRELASRERIVSIEGVLNGTCNFVLDRLHAGLTLEAAVKQAQEAGFAEADASVDLDGIDASHKLVLLAHAAWGVALPLGSIVRDSVARLSSSDVEWARAKGQVHRAIASLAHVEAGGTRSLRARVDVRVVQEDSPFAHAHEEDNCVIIKTESGKSVVLHGRGAGAYPTAESVVGDLLAISREVSRA